MNAGTALWRRPWFLCLGLLVVALLVVRLAGGRDPAGVMVHRLDPDRLRALPAERPGDEALMRHLGSFMPLEPVPQPWRRLNEAQRHLAVSIIFEWRTQFVGVTGYLAEAVEDGPYPSKAEVVEAYRALGCATFAGWIEQGGRQLAGDLPGVGRQPADGGQRARRVQAEINAARRVYLDRNAEAVAGR